jgi:hypothetical protein
MSTEFELSLVKQNRLRHLISDLGRGKVAATKAKARLPISAPLNR